MESDFSLETESNGLSKEMLDRIEKMKMGNSKKQCGVCFDPFLKGF